MFVDNEALEVNEGAWRKKVLAGERRFKAAVYAAYPSLKPLVVRKPPPRVVLPPPLPRVVYVSPEHARKDADTKGSDWRTILAEVAYRHQIPVVSILGANRTVPVVQARQEAMWRMRNETLLSLKQIGIRMGNKDHTTVLHSIRKHAERMGQA